jgi:hypothetical protein
MNGKGSKIKRERTERKKLEREKNSEKMSDSGHFQVCIGRSDPV